MMPNAVVRRTVSRGLMVLLAVLLGCVKTERSFLIVQVCVRDQQGIADLKAMIKSVADVEHMQFIDRSSETQQELKSINNRDVKQSSPLINFGIVGEGGVGLTVGNLGMPMNEIAIGFTGASDRPRARQLANTVIGKLRERWRVESVPEGSAAQGMSECPR